MRKVKIFRLAWFVCLSLILPACNPASPKKVNAIAGLKYICELNWDNDRSFTYSEMQEALSGEPKKPMLNERDKQLQDISTKNQYDRSSDLPRTNFSLGSVIRIYAFNQLKDIVRHNSEKTVYSAYSRLSSKCKMHIRDLIYAQVNYCNIIANGKLCSEIYRGPTSLYPPNDGTLTKADFKPLEVRIILRLHNDKVLNK